MLYPVLFVLTFLVALTGALLESGLRGAEVARDTVLARSADLAIADGVTDFTHALAAYIIRHGSGAPWPTIIAGSTPRAACPQGECPLTYVIRARITAASTSAAVGGNDPARNLQSAVIDEQRLSAVVSIVLRDGSTIVGSRTRFLTYRVFETAPYALVSAERDSAGPAQPFTSAQGDDGGLVGATTDDDTRIHLRLTCRTVIPHVVPFSNDQQTIGNDDLPWGNAAGHAYEVPCSTLDAAVDAFRDERWQNGDSGTSGWTP